MEINWYGHACFQFKNTAAIVTDPFDDSLGLPAPNLQADIVTVSHQTPHHNAIGRVSGPFKVLTRPGEYEIKAVFITGHALHPLRPTRPNRSQNYNVVFMFDIDGLRICHLGDIRHVPGQSQVEAFDNVDILLIPVGGGNSLNAAQAAEVIGIIEPSIVIPMHYHLPNITVPLEPVDKFLKEMGLSQLEPQPKLKLTAGSLPPETQTIILTPQIE